MRVILKIEEVNKIIILLLNFCEEIADYKFVRESAIKASSGDDGELVTVQLDYCKIHFRS
jgi:hypothetical protein